jgi:hypothetical protein
MARTKEKPTSSKKGAGKKPFQYIAKKSPRFTPETEKEPQTSGGKVPRLNPEKQPQKVNFRII